MNPPDVILSNKWTLWFDSPHLHKNYLAASNPIAWKPNIDHVCDFLSLGNFWRLWNNVIPPSRLWYLSAYYLFLTGISPHCLDYNNMKGVTAHFIFPITADIDLAWERSILGVISEQNQCKCLTGISIKKHKFCYEIVYWLGTNQSNFYSEFLAKVGKFYTDLGLYLKNQYVLSLKEKLIF